jgi:membrane protein implicated in regulation of membrane protease activity
METNGRSAQTAEPGQDHTAAEALDQLLTQVAELRAYVMHFVSATADGIKLSVRQAMVWVVLGVLGVIAASSAIVTAIVLLLTGLAGGLAVAFDSALWLGQVVVGFLLLVLIVVGTLIGLRLQQRKSRQKKVQQYAERQLQQRATFGHNVADRAVDTEVQHRR